MKSSDAESPVLRVALTDSPRARLALSRAEAAECLGVSIDSFERHILGDLRVVYVGSRRLIPVRELEKWLDEHATKVGPR